MANHHLLSCKVYGPEQEPPKGSKWANIWAKMSKLAARSFSCEDTFALVCGVTDKHLGKTNMP